MPNNTYYGYGIDENRMFCEWVAIFETKEKKVDLLLEVVNSEFEDEEDLSIGCQAIAVFIQKNNLWVSESLLSQIIANISDNFKHIEKWFSSSDNLVGYDKSWVEKRRKVVLECIEEIGTWPKVISNNYDASVDLLHVIEKQLALGINIQDALNYTFVSLKGIARNNYGNHPNVTVPVDFSNKLENVLVRLKEIERGGVEVGDIVKDVALLLSIKKWLI